MRVKHEPNYYTQSNSQTKEAMKVKEESKEEFSEDKTYI